MGDKLYFLNTPMAPFLSDDVFLIQMVWYVWTSHLSAVEGKISDGLKAA